jgi:ActR/RegA family two-component response regulator
MNCETPWTLDEVTRLAESCGETLTSLFASEDDEASGGGAEAAELAVGSVRIACRVWVGAKATSLQTSPLVAIQPAKDQWRVVPTGDALGSDSYEVERVLIQLGKSKKHRVAVLDDDRDTATSIVDYMSASGLDAQAFFSLDELTKEVDAKPFDGYVLDWLIDKQNTRSLIAAIRAKSQSCPIVLLTGQREKGNADETELAATATFYRLTYLEKPTRSASIMSALQLGFELQAKA